MLFVALVPPLRHAAAIGTSRAILFIASPLTPVVSDLRELPRTTRVVAADGSTLAELNEGAARIPARLDQLPDHVRHAVLAAEDEDFYEHSGVNPEAVFRALVSTVRGRLQGGSTITQQLAKINYTAGERTLLRKFREVLYASKLEQSYTKDQILERYLNQVYFGEGAYGVEAAAQSFFGVPASQLTAGQAAVLAGKLRSPEGLDPRTDPEPVIRRRDQVLANMAEEGWLDGEQRRQAESEPLVLVPPKPPAVVRAPHFVEFVKREARRLEELGPTPELRSNRVFSAGLTIKTTLDPKVFDATLVAAQHHLGEPGDPITATASVEPVDGAIRSLFGGIDFLTTQYDVAGRGVRQPGSAFKPFTYLAALREGISPRSLFDGTSGRRIGCYGDRPVNNYAGEDFGGLIDVDSAMVRSVNVVFVDLGCRVGVRDVLRTAGDAGVPEDATEAQGAVFLGGLDRGVSALTMASAYATFASGGIYAEPYAIAEVSDERGDVIYSRKVRSRRVFEERHVGILNNVLQRVVGEGTGRGAGIGRPVAGKTGTTQDNIDAWFAGYVPQLSTAVWVGYEPPTPMVRVHDRAVTGGSFPASIFRDLMRDGLRGTKVRRLPTASPDAAGLEVVGSTTTTTPTTTLPPPLDVSTTTTLVPGAPPPGGTGADRTTTTTRPTATTSSSTTTSTAPAPTTTRDKRQG